MVEKVREERTETAMKKINSSMEEYNKQMLEMMKGSGQHETQNVHT